MMYSAFSQRSFWRSNLAWTSFISEISKRRDGLARGA